ncbi:AraC family transcriptional regulator [Streptomyces sp. NPDC047081]|uniref:AraC family transcriptional regulator n=1 Tax=Streptomyces sp. NPDC047081 TaxID=3154706 RepID=UPI0033C20588
MQNRERVGEPLGDFRVLQTRDGELARRQVAGELSEHRIEVAPGHQLAMTFNRTQIDNATLMYVAYGAPVRLTAGPVQDHVVIILPTTDRIRAEFDGGVVTATQACAAVIPARTPTRFVGEPGIEALVVKVEASQVAQHLHRLAPHAPGVVPVFEPGLPPNPGLLASAVHALRLAVDGAAGQPVAPPIATELRNHLLTALLFGHRHSAMEQLLAPPAEVSRPLLTKARALIDSTAPSPEEVAAALGLSPRALGTEFRREFGVPLRSYVRTVRLKRVREALLTADPSSGATVTHLALNHGFTHLGRFSVEYRETFGESPSSSLRRAPRQEPISANSPT